MSAQLPDRIVVTETTDGVRYRRPVRPLGLTTLLGSLQAVVGLALIGLGAWGLAGLGIVEAPAAAFFLAGPFLLGLILLGLWVAYVGCWVVFGSDEVRLTPTHLCVRLRIGPLGWTVRREKAELEWAATVLRQALRLPAP